MITSKKETISNILDGWSTEEIVTAWNKRCEFNNYPEIILPFEGEYTLREMLGACDSVADFLERARNIRMTDTCWTCGDGWFFDSSENALDFVEMDELAEYIAREGNIAGTREIGNDELIDAYCEYAGISKARVQAYLDDTRAELAYEDWDDLEDYIKEWEEENEQ